MELTIGREIERHFRDEAKQKALQISRNGNGSGETDNKKGEIGKENIILAYDAANDSKRPKSRKTKLFFKLWFRNLKSRHITIASAIFIVPLIPTNFFRYLIEFNVIDVDKLSSHRKNAFPQMFRLLETQFTSDLATCFSFLLHQNLFVKNKDGDFKRQTIRKAVLLNTRDVLATAVLVQVVLSLIQTVLEFKYHTVNGTQERSHLVTLAKKLNIPNASHMNMDQLRVEIIASMSERALQKHDNQQMPAEEIN